MKMADEMNNYIYFQYQNKIIIDVEYTWILRGMVGIKGEDVDEGVRYFSQL